MTKRIVILFVSVFLLAGCSSYGPEELERLTKEDAQFKQMIAARDQIHAEIRNIKQDLLEKKKTIDANIEKLRGEYDSYAKMQNRKIEKYQNVIEANRNILLRDTQNAESAVETKEKELERLVKTLGDVNAVLRQAKDITLSESEKQKWQERSILVSEKIRPLQDEIQELKARITLNKRKTSFLK